MKSFINNEQIHKDIISVKNRKKANKSDAKKEFENILSDTRTAIDNINECINNVKLLQDIYKNFRKADISFLDKILGLKKRGSNGSHYRDYLSLNEKDIIEIRISDHYETKKSALLKSNNRVQYLYQIVLIQKNPKEESDDAIKTNQKVGNVRILTQGIIGTDYNIKVLETMLRTIADYLSYPDYLWTDKTSENKEINNKITENETRADNIVEKNKIIFLKNMNRKQIRLNESQFNSLVRKIVKKVVKGMLLESDSQVISWAKSNNESFKQAVNIFADYIMANDVSVEDFVNATDLDQCDGFDFQDFYDIVTYNMHSTVYQRANREIDKLTREPYELKKLVEKYYIPNKMVDVWEQTINDEWVDILENENRDDIVEAIYDLKDVSRITNKFAYGGGDYEVLRDLQLATVEEVGNRIKEQIRLKCT